MIVNPAISWLTNSTMKPVAMTNVVLDTVITSLVMSLAIAFFIASATRKALESAEISSEVQTNNWMLSRLPVSWWGFGLSVGIPIAIMLAVVTYGLFLTFGVPELSLASLMVLKALYTGSVAFLLTGWVIKRQLLAVGS